MNKTTEALNLAEEALMYNASTRMINKALSAVREALAEQDHFVDTDWEQRWPNAETPNPRNMNGVKNG